MIQLHYSPLSPLVNDPKESFRSVWFRAKRPERNCLPKAYVALMNARCPLTLLRAANQMQFSSETGPLQLPPRPYQSLLLGVVEKVPELSKLASEWPSKQR